MIRAVIFDLDNCLSAADEVGRSLYEPVFAAVRAANDGSVSEDAISQAYEDSWRIPWNVVAPSNGLTKEMMEAGWAEFAKLEIRQPMRGYGDLDVVLHLPVIRFLVTTGFRRLQESKIDALGIRGWFAEACVDAIDEPGHRGKEKEFERILRTYQFAPVETLIVGDNEDSEIAAGRRLGTRTVQIIRPGVKPGTKAERTIHGLAEMRGIVAGW